MVMWGSILLNLTLLAVIGWEKGWWLVFNSRSNVKSPPTGATEKEVEK